MNRYRVRFERRQEGAIGVFETAPVEYINAHTAEAAEQGVRAAMRQQGWETRHMVVFGCPKVSS